MKAKRKTKLLVMMIPWSKICLTLLGVLWLACASAVQGAREEDCTSTQALEGGKCKPCPKCPLGQGLPKPCGYGRGGDQQCEPCPEHQYHSDPRLNRCIPCMDCDQYHRLTEYRCRPVVNAECGPCVFGYYDYHRGMDDSTVHPCEPCSFNPQDPECETWRISQSDAPAMTSSQSDTTAKVPAPHVRSSSEAIIAVCGCVCVGLFIVCLALVFYVIVLKKRLTNFKQAASESSHVEEADYNLDDDIEAGKYPPVRRPSIYIPGNKGQRKHADYDHDALEMEPLQPMDKVSLCGKASVKETDLSSTRGLACQNVKPGQVENQASDLKVKADVRSENLPDGERCQDEAQENLEECDLKKPSYSDKVISILQNIAPTTTSTKKIPPAVVHDKSSHGQASVDVCPLLQAQSDTSSLSQQDPESMLDSFQQDVHHESPVSAERYDPPVSSMSEAPTMLVRGQVPSEPVQSIENNAEQPMYSLDRNLPAVQNVVTQSPPDVFQTARVLEEDAPKVEKTQATQTVTSMPITSAESQVPLSNSPNNNISIHITNITNPAKEGKNNVDPESLQLSSLFNTGQKHAPNETRSQGRRMTTQRRRVDHNETEVKSVATGTEAGIYTLPSQCRDCTSCQNLPQSLVPIQETNRV